MGKGGGGGGSAPPQQVTSTTTTSNLPEYAKPYFENLMQRAQAESYRQYTPYGGERIAGFTPGQMAVQRETMGMQTPGQFGVGTGMAGAGGLGSLGAGQQYFGMATTPGVQQAFMSPYMQNVMDVQKQAAIRDAQISNLAGNLGAARQGTYGGARQLLAQTERERALGGKLGEIQATGTQRAYEDAQKAMQFGSQLGLQGYGQAVQAGQALGQMGTAQQQADLQRLTAQSAIGSEQRALEQQILDQRYADFLRQRDYPMEQLGYFSNMMRGIPVQLGSTQTTYAPPPSIASQVGGLGLAGLSIGKMAGAFAKGGEVAAYAYGGSTAKPSLEKVQAFTENLSDQELQMRLRSTKPGSHDNLMVAGEIQARDNARKAALAKRGGRPPVIADLLTGGAMPQMPQQIAMLPENAGGVAAMDAPNMENIATLAAGGLVAFEDGGPVARYATAGSVQGLGSSGGGPLSFGGYGFNPTYGVGATSGKPPMLSPPDLEELIKKYGKNALKLFRSGVGMSPSNLLARSQDLNVGEQQYMDALRALNTEFGYPQEQLGRVYQGDVIQRLETERRLAEAQKGKGPDVSRPKEITYFPQGVAPGGVPGKDQTQPGGGLATLGKAQGLDMDSAFAKAQSFIGDKLAALGDPFKDIREEMKTASDERKADLKNSAWMRLAEFGFGMAAGTSPYALANIGKAGVEALKGFGDDLREKKKLDRDDRKMLADIKRLENADKRDNIIKTADLGLKIIGEMNADQRAQLAARTQLAAYGMPGKEERLVDRAMSDPKFAEMYKNLNKSGAIDPRVKLFMDMSYADKMQLKANNPAQYAMLEQLATAAFLPATVGTPDPSKIRP